MNNDTGVPLDYNDPKAEGDVNDFVNRIDISVKWDDADDNETKLERIMTQKWIASYTNTIEIWNDHRRTGYPKLPFNFRNDSNETWGVIASNEFLQRMPFPNSERNSNPDGVASGATHLGGPDLINTRLWIAPEGPNF